MKDNFQMKLFILYIEKEISAKFNAEPIINDFNI